ncbi:hypothetical protein JKF63_03049 [Porcisia hertigi]|uniref:Thioredoxin domain-containing protein n=1 Tax=Porcisia hertigi TaxID=2761500 RepID=A0A836IJ14_9TRYP|nr:hypothetical protein JKF63_03049 [Porcisia hertigi]
MFFPKTLCLLAVLSALSLCASLALATADAQPDLVGAAPYRLKEDCPAQHLTEENFERDTQASSGMTSGNWLILFVPCNDASTVDRHSRQAVKGIVAFDAFVRNSTQVLRNYQVVPAYVLCDESRALYTRFNTEKSIPKLVMLSSRRMYTCPAEQMLSVDDIELFVSTFRSIESSAVPPPLTGQSIWGQLILLLGGVIAFFFILRSLALSRMSAPLPPSMTASHSKAD